LSTGLRLQEFSYLLIYEIPALPLKPVPTPIPFPVPVLTGMVELIHPHGTVDAAGSVNHYVQSIRDMTRKLAAKGFSGGAADLRRGQLAGYWMAASGPREACTRWMLQALPAAGGYLDPAVAELAEGRAFNPQRIVCDSARRFDGERVCRGCGSACCVSRLPV